MFEVIDNGIGMEESQLRLLFAEHEVFTTKGTAGEKGTGLGLLLCKEFVEKNGGEISVQSQTGKGTIFSFKLPEA
jgi:signal transduction histidine kinase